MFSFRVDGRLGWVGRLGAYVGRCFRELWSLYDGLGYLSGVFLFTVEAFC